MKTPRKVVETDVDETESPPFKPRGKLEPGRPLTVYRVDGYWPSNPFNRTPRLFTSAKVALKRYRKLQGPRFLFINDQRSTLNEFRGIAANED